MIQQPIGLTQFRRKRPMSLGLCKNFVNRSLGMCWAWMIFIHLNSSIFLYREFAATAVAVSGRASAVMHHISLFSFNVSRRRRRDNIPDEIANGLFWRSKMPKDNKERYHRTMRQRSVLAWADIDFATSKTVRKLCRLTILIQIVGQDQQSSSFIKLSDDKSSRRMTIRWSLKPPKSSGHLLWASRCRRW